MNLHTFGIIGEAWEISAGNLNMLGRDESYSCMLEISFLVAVIVGFVPSQGLIRRVTLDPLLTLASGLVTPVATVYDCASCWGWHPGPDTTKAIHFLQSILETTNIYTEPSAVF